MAFDASFSHPRWLSVLSFTLSFFQYFRVCGSLCLLPAWPLIKGVNFLDFFAGDIMSHLSGGFEDSPHISKVFSVSECFLLGVQ